MLMGDESTERVCTKCRLVKPLDDFSAAPRGKYGRKAHCKACDAARHAALHPSKPRVYRPRRAPLVGGDPKTCTNCKVEKTVDEFSISRQATATQNAVYQSWCKQCSSERAVQWWRDNRERADANRRRTSLKALYGLTVERYDEMLKAQGGVCAICGNPQKWGKTSRDNLCVDHDHETGAVRGLLCNGCNRAVGFFGDDPVILARAISYLARAKEIHQGKG